MRKILTLAFLICLFLINSVFAENIYNDRGNKIGSYKIKGNYTHYYDKTGNRTNYAQQKGSYTYVYNNSGRLQYKVKNKK